MRLNRMAAGAAIALVLAGCGKETVAPVRGEARQPWLAAIGAGSCALNLHWAGTPPAEDVRRRLADKSPRGFALSAVDPVSQDMLVTAPAGQCSADAAAEEFGWLGQVIVSDPVLKGTDRLPPACATSLAAEDGLAEAAGEMTKRGDAGMIGFRAEDGRLVLETFRNCDMADDARAAAYAGMLRSWN